MWDDIATVAIWVGMWALFDWIWTKVLEQDPESVNKAVFFIAIGAFMLYVGNPFQQGTKSTVLDE
jgi:hypothetical protein